MAVVGGRCYPGMVGTTESTELSHSRMVDDLSWPKKRDLPREGVSDFLSEPHSDRNTLPSKPAPQFGPSPERRSQFQFGLSTVHGISMNRL
jgi:hypothetical protein